MVKNYYSDRVMRQFGLFQQVPPPAPINYQQVLTYRKNKHTSGGGEGQNVNWAQYYWWAQDEPRVAYHGVTTVRLCPALHVHGVVLQERDGYNMVRHGH
jgi:hypothetical protein